MKKSKIVFLAVILIFAFAATSMATLVAHPFGMYDPNSVTPGVIQGNPIDSQTPQELIYMDFSEVGTALAVNANQNNLPVDAPFELLYQTHVTAFTRLVNGSPGTVPVLPPTMNGIFGTDTTPYEFTAVGRIWENYVGYSTYGPGNLTATSSFGLASDPTGGLKPNIMEIWVDSPVLANNQLSVSGGTGFADGIMILSATPIAMPVSTFTTNGDTNLNGIIDNQDSGGGSTEVIFRIDYWDPLFFDFVVAPMMLTEFNSQLYTPPGFATTALMWDGTTVPDFYTAAMVGSPDNTQDIMFRIDGSAKFSPIPEPTTMLLLGSGLIGLASFGRKKRKKNS